MRKVVHRLSFIIVILTVIVSGIGLFWMSGVEPFKVSSMYGNEIMLFGKGIYKNDNAFLAPIFRGTDFVILFIAVPLTTFFIYLDKKTKFV